ncbi:hypothetical protein RND71_018152 [Anisodus tanguticus]|uniref:Uncharacterized protein n=1 Tax=Anisodus tanguticus TaxID=243964 RepID=A0AAE1S3P9_9SOLA|nr:hypothetical protein RND71_018152 [Anisodus tanguticus]
MDEHALEPGTDEIREKHRSSHYTREGEDMIATEEKNTLEKTKGTGGMTTCNKAHANTSRPDEARLRLPDHLNYIHPRGRVHFVIGALMGFYRAWPAFALTHHLVIWFVEAQVYLGVPFTRYATIGDDIIIRDEQVAECYRELISPLNVPFSLEKSLVSSVGALEFAKRFFIRGVTKEFFPVSYHILRSLVSSISLVPVMKVIMSKDLPLSYHLREVGYQVYT